MLAKQAAGFAWDAYFRALGLEGVETLVVRQPAFFRELGRMAQGVPLSEWKTYLRWHLLRATAAYLSSPFEREAFAFNGTTLEGIPRCRPLATIATWLCPLPSSTIRPRRRLRS